MTIEATMDCDSEACKQSEILFVVWTRNLEKNAPDQLAAKLAFTHCGEVPIEATYHAQGAFNRCYGVNFEKRSDVVVRLPALGSHFPQGKY